MDTIEGFTDINKNKKDILRGMTDDARFCYKCGANLPEGSEFCPECGARTQGNSGEERAEYTAQPTRSKSQDAGILPILMAIYGILSIIFCFMLISMGLSIDALLSMLTDMAVENPSMAEDINRIKELLLSVNFNFVAIVMLLSGICALISYAGASKLEHFQRTIIFCAVATALPAFTYDIFLVIIGVIVTVLLYTKKDKFVS